MFKSFILNPINSINRPGSQGLPQNEKTALLSLPHYWNPSNRAREGYGFVPMYKAAEPSGGVPKCMHEPMFRTAPMCEAAPMCRNAPRYESVPICRTVPRKLRAPGAADRRRHCPPGPEPWPCSGYCRQVQPILRKPDPEMPGKIRIRTNPDISAF